MKFFENGRMIGGSKSGYMAKHPHHIVVFNANICTKSQGKIWYGDLDLSLDGMWLVDYRKQVGEDLFILYEMDARFENETKPKFDSAVAIVTGTDVNIRHR